MNMLRSIRERKGLTVGQLAARASIPSRVLTEYEEGRQPIPLPHAKLLAKALWVQMEELLPAAGSMPQPPPNPSPVPPPAGAYAPRPQAPAAAPPTQPRPAGAISPVPSGGPRRPPRDVRN